MLNRPTATPLAKKWSSRTYISQSRSRQLLPLQLPNLRLRCSRLIQNSSRSSNTDPTNANNITTTTTTTTNKTHHQPYHTTPRPKMRIPYAPSEPPADAPTQTREIYARIAERRKPRPLIPLDLALLHNPSIADGWNTLLGAIRSKTTLDAGLLEMAVARIAVLNGAVWEWAAHAPLALKGGLSRAALEVVRTAALTVGESGEGQGPRARTAEEEEALSGREWAVLCYTDQMTRQVQVDDVVFDALREFLDEAGIMEITATVATYNCVSRFLVALNVGEKNGLEMKMPEA
ncbi:hypothetical protein MBLNU459_g6111t2 [Dothideomycetes sp. NU459]